MDFVAGVWKCVSVFSGHPPPPPPPHSTKLDSLQHNLEEQKKRHQVENEEMRTRLHMLEEEKGQVVVDKEELQNTCEEFRKESESILLDYNMCAQRLKVAEETANRMTAQHQKDTTEQARLRERISLLEQSRKEQDDKLNHMDQQVGGRRGEGRGGEGRGGEDGWM